MHELSIAHDMVGMVTENIARFPAARVASLTVTLGVYSGVDPEALRFAFPVAAEGTLLEGAELVIETLPVTFRCRNCGAGPFEAGAMMCPRCRSLNIEVTTGREIDISSVEIIEPDEGSVKNNMKTE